jgi:hypothetical protein
MDIWMRIYSSRTYGQRAAIPVTILEDLKMTNVGRNM